MTIASHDMASPAPGLLYVHLQQGCMNDAELNNWYNNQHTPVRMRYPFFLNGRRYKQIWDTQATPVDKDSSKPMSNWLALYDISDMTQLDQPPYTTLLTPNIQGRQDQESIARVTASRRYFDHVAAYSAPGFNERQLLYKKRAEASSSGILIIVHVKLASSGMEAETEWDRWYEQDHLPALRKVPGWLRTRRYRSLVLELKQGEPMEYLTLNEFADPSKVGGPEHQIAIKTESRTNIVAAKKREYWKLDLALGKGPKDLTSLATLQDERGDYASPNGLIRTRCAPWPNIESTVRVDGSGAIQYRIEGRGDQFSPIIALGTDAGLGWSIWDHLAFAILKNRDDVRILRVCTGPSWDHVDVPLTSGAAFLQLADAMRVVSRELVLPDPALVLAMGIAGETVEKRFDNYLIEAWSEIKNLNSRKGCYPRSGFAITARSRNAIDLALIRLVKDFDMSGKVAE